MKLLLASILVAYAAAAPQFPAYRAPLGPNYPLPAPGYPVPGFPAPGYPAPAPAFPPGGYYARPRAAIDRNAAILRADSQVTENGFNYAFETDNGIQAQESGVEAGGIQAAGSYSYIGDDGQRYAVRYTADAGGFRPEGAHLPTPPPIPAAILRSLELNARDEARGVFDNGSYNSGKYVAPLGPLAARTYPNYRPPGIY